MGHLIGSRICDLHYAAASHQGVIELFLSFAFGELCVVHLLAEVPCRLKAKPAVINLPLKQAFIIDFVGSHSSL